MIASVRLASSSITLTASQRLGAAAAVPHGTQLRFVRSAACIGRLAAARAPHMPRHVLALALANCVQSYSCGDGSSTHSPGQWAMVTYNGVHPSGRVGGSEICGYAADRRQHVHEPLEDQSTITFLELRQFLVVEIPPANTAVRFKLSLYR